MHHVLTYGFDYFLNDDFLKNHPYYAHNILDFFIYSFAEKNLHHKPLDLYLNYKFDL